MIFFMSNKSVFSFFYLISEVIFNVSQDSFKKIVKPNTSILNLLLCIRFCFCDNTVSSLQKCNNRIQIVDRELPS